VTRVERRPDPAPREADDVRVVSIGTAIWLVLLVALLPFTGRLRADGHLWWIATCAVGAGLGGLGVLFLRRRRSRR